MKIVISPIHSPRLFAPFFIFIHLFSTNVLPLPPDKIKVSKTILFRLPDSIHHRTLYCQRTKKNIYGEKKKLKKDAGVHLKTHFYYHADCRYIKHAQKGVCLRVNVVALSLSNSAAGEKSKNQFHTKAHFNRDLTNCIRNVQTFHQIIC